MMEQPSMLSRIVGQVVGFLGTVPSTIRDGITEVADTLSPARKRRRSSTASNYQPYQQFQPYQPYQPSPDDTIHTQHKRPRLSDASASNAAGPSVSTPAAFRSAQDLLAAATSPAHPNSQIVTRDAIDTHPAPAFSAPPPEPSLPTPNHSARFLTPTSSLTSNLDIQNTFHYPFPERRSPLTGLRGIWPQPRHPSETRRRSSGIIYPHQSAAEKYWQRVEQRHRTPTARSRISLTSRPHSARVSCQTPGASQPHPPARPTLANQKYGNGILTTQSPPLPSKSITRARTAVRRHAGIQKKRFRNDARIRQCESVKKLSAAAVVLKRPRESTARERDVPDASYETNMSLVKDSVPLPFVEILEKHDSILCQKLLKMHGTAMTRLVKSQRRSRHRQLECWLAEQDLKQIQRKREEARRLNEIESQVWKQCDYRLQQPPKDDKFIALDYWHEKDPAWNEEMDSVALAERKKRITVVEEKAPFAPLSESAIRRIRAALNDHSNHSETLSRIDGCIITGEDLRRLNPNCWLNDEIVNAYMGLLSARTDRLRNSASKSSSISTVPNVKIMSSFFYSTLVQFSRKLERYEYNYSRVRRWTRRFDVFSFDVLLIPINQQNVHWTLGVIDMRKRKVEHLDSMGTGGSPAVREFLMRWVIDEAEDKQKSIDRSKWKVSERRVPIQENTDDCGVFLCKYADFICRGWNKFTFSQRHMNYFRARIAHELLVGRA